MIKWKSCNKLFRFREIYMLYNERMIYSRWKKVHLNSEIDGKRHDERSVKDSLNGGTKWEPVVEKVGPR